MKICDIHSHVLFGVDDGAQTLEQSLEMLKNAVASDVQTLVATPHVLGGQTGDIRGAFLKLKDAAADIPMELLLGGEVRVTDGFSALLRQKTAPTINGGRYLLTEFSSDSPSGAFMPVLKDVLAQGYVPLVAHPERYRAVAENSRMVENWLNIGCHLQLTGGSIRGDYGKTAQKTAQQLLRADYVACIASDAHDLHRRSNFLMDIYDHLAVQYAPGYARCLLYTNPMAICHDETI